MPAAPSTSTNRGSPAIASLSVWDRRATSSCLPRKSFVAPARVSAWGTVPGKADDGSANIVFAGAAAVNTTANGRERPTRVGWAGRFPPGRCLIENNPKQSPSIAVYFRFRIVFEYDNGSLLFGQGLRQRKFVEWARIPARPQGAGDPPGPCRHSRPCRSCPRSPPLQPQGDQGRGQQVPLKPFEPGI